MTHFVTCLKSRRRIRGATFLFFTSLSLLISSVLSWANPESGDRPLVHLSSERILFRTNFGDLVFGLYPNVAPKHSKQFLLLAKAGVYDQTYFYRLEKDFVLQLANATDRNIPLAPQQVSLIHKIPAEFSEIPHQRGVLSMARYDHDINSAETSFSILLAPAPHLDHNYTVFGALLDGDDVLRQIERIPVDKEHRPLPRVEVQSVFVMTLAQYDQFKKNGKLLGPQPIPYISGLPGGVSSAMSSSNSQAGELPYRFIVFAGVLLVLGLLVFIFAGRVPTRVMTALGLGTALVAFFGLWMTLVPFGQKDPLVGGVIFLSLILVYRLMGLFESR